VPRKSSSKSPSPGKAAAPPPEQEAEADAEAEEGVSEPVVAATDNVGDISVEVNVEDLIAQIESESKGGTAPDGSARRKIEDILEEKRVAREIMDLEDFDIDE
jgi:hypothetical protein